MINKCEEEFLNDLGNYIRNTFQQVVKGLNTEVTFLQDAITVSLFEYIGQNKAFLKAVLGPKGDLSFQMKFKNFITNLLIEKQDRIFKEEKFLVPTEFFIAYLFSAHLGVIQQWLNSDKEYSAQEVTRFLSTISINGPLYAAGLKK